MTPRATIISLLTSLPAMVLAFAPLDDAALSDIHGQALFVSDIIAPNSLPGSQGTNSPTDFHFYRMGIDGILRSNMNIDKLQLGCGGFNETVRGNACDIDMDFVSFMGRNGDSPGGPSTSFSLTRPYIELAIKNPGSTSLREVAGLKIGAQSADGWLSIGRFYTNGQINLENGGTCNPGDTSAAGAGRLACHSGINSMSGFLNIRAEGIVRGCATLLGGAFGLERCWNGGAVGSKEELGTFDTMVTDSGTRLTTSTMSPSIVSFLAGIKISATVTENLRFLHGALLKESPDFSISLQREKIAYPRYNKTGYAETANAGWWMNMPAVQLVGVQAISPNATDNVLGALFGLSMQNINLSQTPARNCFGSQTFC